MFPSLIHKSSRIPLAYTNTIYDKYIIAVIDLILVIRSMIAVYDGMYIRGDQNFELHEVSPTINFQRLCNVRFRSPYIFFFLFLLLFYHRSFFNRSMPPKQSASSMTSPADAMPRIERIHTRASSSSLVRRYVWMLLANGLG